MKLFVTLIFLLNLTFNLFGQKIYFPKAGTSWEKQTPKNTGINAENLQKAVDFALSNEYSGSRDLRQAILKGFESEPYHSIQGPTKKRGGPAGMILKNGYLIASWGDTQRVDMT
ncbi:MAG: serine hydrolase, partial [Leeuwenhoekiella sp.]